MLQNKYDIAIIGGGLAGLCLSIQFADAGYNAVLFEKEHYPFHKVCGEYISFESWQFLQRLGVDLNEVNLPAIKQLQVSDAKGKLYNFNLPLGGFGISRYKIDNALYKIALQKKVTVFTNTKVSAVNFSKENFNVITTSGIFNSAIAAGSYGKRSNIDVKLNRSFIREKANKLNNYIGIKYHVQYPQPKDTIALHNFENGYCGISSIEDDNCCLCYLTTAANLQKHHNNIATMEKHLLQRNPFLKKIFNEARFLYNEPLAISQISFSKKKQVENNILMVGDAAGMITPLCGNGMSMAMHASKIAFENMHIFLQGKTDRKNMELNYTKQWQQQFEKRLRMGRIVQRLFGGNRTTGLFLSVMNRLPFLANKIIKSTHGDAF